MKKPASSPKTGKSASAPKAVAPQAEGEENRTAAGEEKRISAKSGRVRKTGASRPEPGAETGASPARGAAGTASSRSAAAAAPAPEHPSAQAQANAFDQAAALFHAREYARARALFESARAGPNRAMAHAAQLHVRMCDHRISRAAPQLDTPEDRYNYAVALINRRELEPAELQLREALSSAANADYMHYALALCLGLRGDLDGAVLSLKRAIELQPSNRLAARNDADFREIAQYKPLRDLIY